MCRNRFPSASWSPFVGFADVEGFAVLADLADEHAAMILGIDGADLACHAAADAAEGIAAAAVGRGPKAARADQILAAVIGTDVDDPLGGDTQAALLSARNFVSIHWSMLAYLLASTETTVSMLGPPTALRFRILARLSSTSPK